MSESNINNLPPEILTKVFRFLDVVDLKNATLTCTFWKNLIESTCRWSLKLNYDYSGKLEGANNTKQKTNFIMTTNRKFGTIKITGGRLSEDSTILLIFQKHGFNVVQLILLTSHVDNLSAATELLNLTPNLNHVHLDIFNSVIDTQLGHISPELNKLKSLYMDVEDQRIVQCFQKTKLRKIKVWEYGSEHTGSLVDFVLSQDTLTSFAVDTDDEMSPSLLAELGKLKVPFQLTQLVITGHVCDRDNLLRFVESQAKNLVELEIGSQFLSFLYKCIIERMPKLNTLSVVNSARYFNFGNDFYDELETNCSVRTIKLLFSINNDRMFQFFGKFFEKLPNFRSLIFWRYSYLHQEALLMAQSLSKLESLAIELYDNELYLDCVKFSNLKTLHIQHLSNKIDWNKFTKIHSRLTKLIIEQMENNCYLTSYDIDQITTNVDLQHIRLGVGFVADDRFFEIIRTKCLNLKILRY